jgi:TolB-like protein/DNA-binding CsgD family transcriptional regulator
MSDAAQALNLSKRQLQIAEAYVRSASYRQVAEDLCLAPSTVRTHVAVIYRKLEVTNKIELFRALGSFETNDTTKNAPIPRAASKRPSVIVLPFENRSGEQLPDFVSYGLIDGVTSTLSRFRNLFVISSNSCLALDGGREGALLNAASLGVRYAVNGWLWRAQDQVRVSAEIVDVASKGQIWTGQFDGIWTDIVNLQDELARTIASTIAPEIETHEMDRVRSKSVENLDAWELYCKAYLTFLRIDQDSGQKAKELCHRAIVLDRHFAAPHSLLARSHFYDVFSGRSKDRAESLELGVAHARTALGIDSRDDVAHTVLGYNLAMKGEFDHAYAAINRGLDLNPNSSELYNARTLVHLLSPQGCAKDAIEDERMALSLSPNDPLRWAFLVAIGWAILVDTSCGTPEDAIEAFHQASVVPTADWQVFLGLALAHLSSGNPDAAQQAVRMTLARQPTLEWEDVLNITTPLLNKSTGQIPKMDQIHNWLQEESGMDAVR